jgi:hypothetical protein
MAKIAILSTDLGEQLPLYIAERIADGSLDFTIALYIHEIIGYVLSSRIPPELLPPDRLWCSDIAPEVICRNAPSDEHQQWEEKLGQKILSANVQYVVCDYWKNGGLFFSSGLRRAFRERNIQVLTYWGGPPQWIWGRTVRFPIQETWRLYCTGRLPDNEGIITCFCCHLAEDDGYYDVLGQSKVICTQSVKLEQFEKTDLGAALYRHSATKYFCEVICAGLNVLDGKTLSPQGVEQFNG